MKYLYATISGLMLGAAAAAAPAPTTPPAHASTALPPSMSTRCPPGSANTPPVTRAPFATTGTHAMPRNPDARIPPEQPMHPQPPEPNPPPCR